MSDYNTKANRELILAFFLTFSRFEYALKASGFFKKPNEKGYDTQHPPMADPDWDSFAVSLRTCFSTDRSEQLALACEYLLGSPPNKQVILRDGPRWTIAWETPVRPQNEADIEFILRMVRSIRNNLFHGGKYSTEVHKDTERTEQLLRSSITILEECLGAAPRVRTCFDDATI
jgi:hypothetical protein